MDSTKLSSNIVCVTGASGFIASWLVAMLLKKGYVVHGAVRNPDDDSKCGHLKALEHASERLTLFKADLLDYESLVPAIRGCNGVFHTACPVPLKLDNPEDDMLLPAIKGTENVLRACYEQGVNRIIMTSTFSTVYARANIPENEILDESGWSNVDFCRENKQWYRLAKTEAERLAWRLSQKYKLDLITVLPVGVIGTLLQPTMNTSSEQLKRLADGSSQSSPNSYVSIVDVRDTAEVHILVYEKRNVSGGYLCAAETVLFKDIVKVMKKNFPYLPYPERSEGEKTEGFPPSRISNKKVQGLIKQFIPYEQSLIDSVESFIAKGFINRGE